MGLILIVLLNASAFSISDFGEDLGVFRTPFLGNLGNARIEFSLQPEISILNENSNARGIFWTNPFSYSMKVPLGKGFSIFFGNSERFNQSFDLYRVDEPLTIHLKSNGGVDEAYGQINCHNNFAEIFFRGAYLFGNAREIWDYTLDNYSIADTFMYKYEGRSFCTGLKIFFLSLSYEGLSTLEMSREAADTTYALPQVLSLGFDRYFSDYDISLIAEHVFLDNNGAIDRLKIGLGKRNLGIAYFFNPWYYNDIKENGVSASYKIPIHNLGFCSFNLNTSLRTRGTLREFRIVPELRFTLEEIFSRRKK